MAIVKIWKGILVNPSAESIQINHLRYIRPYLCYPFKVGFMESMAHIKRIGMNENVLLLGPEILLCGYDNQFNINN